MPGWPLAVDLDALGTHVGQEGAAAEVEDLGMSWVDESRPLGHWKCWRRRCSGHDGVYFFIR